MTQEQAPSFMEEIAPVLTPTQEQALASDPALALDAALRAAATRPENPLPAAPEAPPIQGVTGGFPPPTSDEVGALNDPIFVPTGTGMGTYGGRPVCYQPTPGAVDLYDPLTGELVASEVPWIGKAGA